MKSIKYRPEIDGLRAIAVLSVLAYHADFFLLGNQILQGGFFGVDVFFVISGFLITSLITKELDTTKRFSYLSFYDRRIRRLVPPLVFVLIVCFPFAWILLLPINFVDFSKSVIWSNLFVSNLYWAESLQVYGAEASNLKPLLHTWSLAIEEQFYIIYPFLLIVIFKWFRPYILFVFVVICLISLYFAESRSINNPLESFYLLHTRFWELLAGGLLVFVGQFFTVSVKERFILRSAPVVGLGLIFYSIIFIDFEGSNHPGIITLIPVVGTCLVIGFSNQSELVIKILSHKLMVYLGLISYSLYLWHFPLFAFMRISGLFDTLLFKLIGVCVAILLSSLSYKYVEQPFRSNLKTPAKTLFYSVFISVSIILFTGYLVIKKDGFPNRFNQKIAFSVKEMKAYRKTYWDSNEVYTDVKDFTENNVSVVVIGNSWAKDVANALIERSDFEVNFEGMTGHRCKAITLNLLQPGSKYYLQSEEKCLQDNIMRFKVKLPDTNLVILADDKWMLKVNETEITNEVLKNISYLRSYGYEGPVLVISNRPTYTKSAYEIIGEYGALGDGINSFAANFLSESISVLKEQDNVASEFYKRKNVDYYSLVDSLCPSYDCLLLRNNAPLYYDKEHLTRSGAHLVGGDLVSYINKNILKR